MPRKGNKQMFNFNGNLLPTWEGRVLLDCHVTQAVCGHTADNNMGKLLTLVTNSAVGTRRPLLELNDRHVKIYYMSDVFPWSKVGGQHWRLLWSLSLTKVLAIVHSGWCTHRCTMVLPVFITSSRLLMSTWPKPDHPHTSPPLFCSHSPFLPLPSI